MTTQSSVVSTIGVPSPNGLCQHIAAQRMSWHDEVTEKESSDKVSFTAWRFDGAALVNQLAMGMQSSTDPRRLIRMAVFAVLCLLCALPVSGQTIQASSAPLMLPTTIVFDAAGNLYLAETNRHVVDRVDASGTLTVLAGNGVQGYSGDGGPGTAAQLDSPQGIAVDASGNVYIADTHNHAIRMWASQGGTITTIAGTGSAGYSGDGGQAIRALLNMPVALALDGNGSLYIADANNHRVRRVTLATGLIQIVAGNGTQAYTGDGGSAVSASIDTPTGLSVDAAGNLYIADTHNHRVRRVAHDTGVITTAVGGGATLVGTTAISAAGARLLLPRGLSVDAGGNLYVADTQAHRILRVGSDGTIIAVAGEGTQGFAGDNGLATAALLDSPRSASVSPAGLVTVADTANQRVRQVGADGILRPFSGIGSAAQSNLSLTAPSVVLYGTGSVTASLASSTAASGVVSFYEVSNNLLSLLGSGTLAGDSATFSTAQLAAGSHRILATYAGDASHASVESSVLGLTVSPALVSVSPFSATVLYGQAIPVLTSTLAGVLSQDAGSVAVSLTTNATSLSPVGSYPITVSLSGSAAGNYRLVNTSGGTLTVAQAPTTTTVAASAVTANSAATLSAQVASTTQGVPTGRVSFADGGTVMGTSALDATGTGTLTATLAAGTHSVTAAYLGDTNFLASVSASLSELVSTTTTTTPSPVASADFTLSASGSVTQTATAGASAAYGFAVSVVNGPLNSPILLTASGMPAGATTTFSPTYLPPGGSGTSFTFTVQTAKASARVERRSRGVFAVVVAMLLPVGFWRRRFGRIEWLAVFAGMVLVGSMTGCGDRVAALPSATAANATAAVYPIVVTATTTLASGTVLQHSAAVTLTVQ